MRPGPGGGRLLPWLERAWRFARRPDSVPRRPTVMPELPPGRVVYVPGRGEMFVRDTGGSRPEGQAGPNILLVHGWTLSADLNWFRLYGQLARRGRVLGVDLRGHGRGLRSELPFSLEDAADDLAGLLDELGAGPAVVVGYSLGGSVALLLAHRHPRAVAGLVLAATALQWRRSVRDRCLWQTMAVVEYAFRLGAPRGLAERYLRDAADRCPDLKPYTGWLKSEIRRGNPADIATAGRALSRFDGRRPAWSVEVPAAVVVTAADRLVPRSRQEALAAAIPGATMVTCETAHNGWLVLPGDFGAAVETAVDRVLSRAGAPGSSELAPSPPSG